MPPPLPAPLAALLWLPDPAGSGTRVPVSPLVWMQWEMDPGGRWQSETEAGRCELTQTPANGVIKCTPELSLHADVPAVAREGMDKGGKVWDEVPLSLPELLLCPWLSGRQGP